MCRNFALIKNNGTVELCDSLGVDDSLLSYSPDIGPADTISIITGDTQNRAIKSAIWWLYLQQTSEGLKPHKDYFSVNTNHAKLDSKPEYRQARCIIPASAFVKSQGGKPPHLLETTDGSAFAFGGLYKVWTDKITGEVIYSTSIITLPSHKLLEDIHRKSIPLWLPEDRYQEPVLHAH